MSVKNLKVSETDSHYLTEDEKISEMKKDNISKLSDRVKEAKEDIKKGNYITGDHKDVMKAIDDEIKSHKQV